MKIPVEPDSRALRLADHASQRPPSVGKGRRHLSAAPGRVFILAALFVTLPWIGKAQQASPTAGLADYEPLSEQVTDPLSHLTQIQIKDPYTPAEYGTNAQPNTVQLRAIFAIHPFSFIPVEQLVRPTIRVVTVPNGKGASTTTAYDDMQLLDLCVMPWPNSRATALGGLVHGIAASGEARRHRALVGIALALL
ncbi:MAG TPA: hypothetical protein VNF49_00565 [Candidatus Binataceae bacterium]|nr:hypothetical protein [Candidatus Binataceae bacterium]